MLSKSLLAFAACTALAALPVTALAAGGDSYDTQAGVKATNVQVVWHIDLAGVDLGKLALSAILKGDEYTASSWLETGGVVNWFWESRIDADSRGVFGSGKVVPEAYNSDYKGAKSKQKVALSYANGFPGQLTAIPEYDLKRFPVTEEQKEGTIDPLSGMVLGISAVTATEASPCGTAIPVFDGRRRYNVNFTYRHNVEVDEGKHGYRGPALECELQYEQIAGFKPQLEDAKDREVPKIYAWLAPVKREDSDKAVLIPIKIWASTGFGTATAVARHIKINDAAPKSAMAAPGQ